MSTTRRSKKKGVKFFWPKWIKGKGFVQNRVKGSRDGTTSSDILINGALLTCIGLSIASGFVDIVCYSGLSKSVFHVGTWPLAASILYTLISVCLTSAKFWVAMRIGMMLELRTKLATNNFSWSNEITKALIPWQIAHKCLILISLLTAMSMSVNSIGAGIRTMQQNINNMTVDANTLIDLNSSVNSGIKEQRSAAKSTINDSKQARDTAKDEVERYYDRLVKYQSEYFEIQDKTELTDEEKQAQSAAVINKIVKDIPGTTARNAIYFSKADLQKSIQSVATALETVDNSDLYKEAVEYDKSQIEDTIKALADKEYKTPDGTLIKFINEDGTVVNVQLAISRLQGAISMWQSDTGDVGESAKVFNLIASYIKADPKAGGMSAAEWLIMAFIFFSGLLQEFLIKLFTPAGIIDAKSLHLVEHSLRFKDSVEKGRFLVSVYGDYVMDKVLTEEQADTLCAETVRTSEKYRVDDVYKRYSFQNFESQENATDFTGVTMPKGYSDKVATAMNEIDKIIEKENV